MASLVRFRYSLPGCLPPCTDQTGILPQPPGTFTSRLSTDRSSSPLLDITTTATGLLVWGLFCQGVSGGRRILFPSSVSLFDLEARFFVPTRRFAQTVDAQELSRLAVAPTLGNIPPSRPYLDGFEHDGTLGAVGRGGGMTIRGKPAFGRGSIAPQPCIRWAQGPEP